MKTCNKCRAEKPIEEFSRNHSCKDGRKSHCKKCEAEQKKKLDDERKYLRQFWLA
jgi:hypothetical protein